MQEGKKCCRYENKPPHLQTEPLNRNWKKRNQFIIKAYFFVVAKVNLYLPQFYHYAKANGFDRYDRKQIKCPNGTQAEQRGESELR